MKPHVRNRLFLLVLAIILYVVLAPLRMIEEPGMQRNWLLTSAELSILPPITQDEETESIFGGDSVIYINENGGRAHSIQQIQSLSYDQDRYARSDKSGIVVYERSGTEIFRLPGEGSPYFSGHLLFALNADGTAFRVYSLDGQDLWSYQGESLITGLAADYEGNVYVGFLNGQICWIDSLGNEVSRIRPGNGKTQIIYGLVWVDAWKRIAAIVDLEPQSLVLIESGSLGDSASLRVRQRVTLPVPQHFAPLFETLLNDTYVGIEQPSGIAIIGTADQNRLLVPLDNPPVAVADIVSGGIVVIGLNTKTGSRIVGIKPDGRIVFVQESSGTLYDIRSVESDGILVSSTSGLIKLSLDTK